MRLLMNVVRRVAHAMHMVAGVLLIVMAVTVLIEVVTRALFGMTGGGLDLTIRGGVEIVSYSLLFMVLFALPYSVSRGQVIVDLFTENMSERLKMLLAGIYTLGFSFLGFAMATRFYESVGRVAMSGETTQDLLIPLTYIYAISAFATFMLGLRGLFVAIDEIGKGLKRS